MPRAGVVTDKARWADICDSDSSDVEGPWTSSTPTEDWQEEAFSRSASASTCDSTTGSDEENPSYKLDNKRLASTSTPELPTSDCDPDGCCESKQEIVCSSSVAEDPGDNHAQGVCRPCIFTVMTGDCGIVGGCTFCHLPHSKRFALRSFSKAKRERFKKLWVKKLADCELGSSLELVLELDDF